MKQQRGDARVQLPVRDQIEIRMMSLEQMVPENHLVRVVVRFVESLDLSELYAAIRSTAGGAGRSPIDPRILFSLWLFATLEGETSGRRIARLTERDTIYMFLCGGVSVNYHTLCDFRVDHGDLVERVLTDSVAVLHHNGLIRLETIAQDGMRVRASAGAGSFRREGSLKEAQQKAQEYLKELNENEEDDEGTTPRQLTTRQQSARRRAAEEKVARVNDACQQMEELKVRHEKRNRGKSSKNRTSAPRASTTDPDARRMKMGDTGFRPAFNVQFASDADALVIVDVDVTREGTDSGQLDPMYQNVCDRYGTTPENYLADGGFRSQAGVTALESNGTKFFGPLPNERKRSNEKKQLAAGEDPYSVRAGENKSFTAYRQRMRTDEAKAIYRRRAAAAEFPNANCRNHGLLQFKVRGLLKAKAQSLWHALAYNIRRFCNLRVRDSETTFMEVLLTP